MARVGRATSRLGHTTTGLGALTCNRWRQGSSESGDNAWGSPVLCPQSNPRRVLGPSPLGFLTFGGLWAAFAAPRDAGRGTLTQHRTGAPADNLCLCEE